ncbi:MAG TPA: ABC transporter substrate-binding protein, partial [Thermoanaerobaculia bacterium]|nr:ABC transporter substrate-binding protein [Thermoanaerobaculia bacterium]
GPLARELTRIVKEFNDKNPDIEVVAVYTGSYDDTRVKAQAALAAGKPPGVALMSANFVLEFVLNKQIEPIEDYLVENKLEPKTFLDDFWPAVRPNATIDGKIYAIPYQNSTPLLYLNADHFREAGLDPDKPPVSWADLVSYAEKLTKREGGQVTRWGLTMPSTYDYCGWLIQSFTMANGGLFYNPSYGGEVYYDQPSTLGALQLWKDLAFKYKVMPQGVIDPNQVSADFFSGKASMVVLSTGSLTFIRNGAKFPYKVGFMPRNVRNAVPIGGGSLIAFAGLSPEQRKAAWRFMSYMTSAEQLGHWSRFTGYFSPRKAAYDLPEMKQYLQEHPDAKVALDQLVYAVPWFDTYNTVAVRKAMEDQVQAILSAKVTPADASAAAQKAADELLRPYVEQTALKAIG